ncbi:DUF2785 domain-containing protein [Nocardioides acrostichi]|uniref:DUF2785 domain-containing protein n=1 Tax=Nocardioides acrostichi TaxID=2784339 RepID=A0A930Y544_9ACTN|nr:DUF2785 domain-containing protein [Nocardioides acrostichi]MBF4160880.1 DUF2785 domain-containing protein [Nocardioides acrostichi]
MAGSYWEQVIADDMSVPTDRPLGDLTAELTRMLGDTDPLLRDDIALPTLATWIERGVYDDLLAGLGDGMTTGLSRGLGGGRRVRGDDASLGPTGPDAVFRRSFSALVLGVCIERDNAVSVLPDTTVLGWGDRLVTWLLGETDQRGWVPGKGWAHAVAHGADALAALAASRHLGTPELTVLLDVVADLAITSTEQRWTAGEPDRLAGSVLAVLRRDLVPMSVLEPWIERLLTAATMDPASVEDTGADPYAATHNAEAFLRALYLRLAIGPRPPEVRGDLVLVLVDALRRSTPWALGPTA